MFDGRHCTNKDLDLLVKETNKIKQILLKNTEKCEKNEDLQCFLTFIKRFDEQIAHQLEIDVSIAGTDCERIVNAIDKYTNELKRNVQVDILEHQ